MRKRYNINYLKYKIRLFKYIIIYNLSSMDKKERIANKIVPILVRFGNYNLAINYYENLLFSEQQFNYYFPLLNLYILSNNQDKEKFLIKNYSNKKIANKHTLKIINKLNDTINNYNKLMFINEYIEKQGASCLFLLIHNRGVSLNKKSEEEVDLLLNKKIYIEQRSQWAAKNNPPEYIKNLYSQEQQTKIDELYYNKPPIVRATKIVPPDYSNSLVSVKDGLKTTKFQPEKANRKILFFGASTTFSLGCSDQDTLTSQVQKNINKNISNIKVENHSFLGMSLLIAMNNLVQTEIKPNDIVVFFDFDEFKSINSELIEKIDLNKIDRGNNFFIDLDKCQCHFSPKGNKVIAEQITNDFVLPKLAEKEGKTIDKKPLNKNMLKVLEQFKYFLYKTNALTCESGEMKDYLELLEKYKVDQNLKIGSIAVNCNPITNGHMHLIEYAAKQVDKLYIFVIEEDLSFFKYKDRLRLVTQSTAHIENITVLPGGKFICTELTYPDYFDKDHKSETIADASMEAWYFCEFIAKKLGIKKIFLGDEPTCKVTKQYNDKMLELLPEYGIEVDIIDRVSENGKVISASTVRACLEKGDFDTIRQIVPLPTYNFLKETYETKS